MYLYLKQPDFNSDIVNKCDHKAMVISGILIRVEIMKMYSFCMLFVF